MKLNIVIAEVLAVRRQLVALERGQHLAQLQEEPFARRVVVGVHVELGIKFVSYLFHLTSYLFGQQRGGGDGNGLVTGGEHRPAVGAAFGDEERVARAQAVEHGQVVDAT